MYFLWSILGKLLGFSVFLMLDTLTSIIFHLRAIGGKLNARFQLQEQLMLSKCYVSKRNGTKGWVLKLNKDSILEMTIGHLP